MDTCNIPKQLLKPWRPRPTAHVVPIDIIMIISLYRYKSTMNLLIRILENKDICIIYTLTVVMVPKCALVCTCKLTWIIRYTLIISTLMNSYNVSIIHRLYCLYSSQQHLGHSAELMRKPSLIEALSKQHSFMCNSKQNIMHNCTWMLCIT